MAGRDHTVRLVTIAVALTLLAATALGVLWWRSTRQSELESALALLPADTLRASWTDWQGVRAELGVQPDEQPGGTALRALTDQAFDRDLSAASSLADSAVALQRNFGFSPATADWELYGQSDRGATVLVHLPADTDFESLADKLRGLGYVDPSQTYGVWAGGADLVPRIDPTLTPELQYVALLPDERLVLASDTEAYLRSAIRSATGDGPHLTGVDALAEHVADPLAAVVFAGDFACTALTMAQADDGDRAEAEHLVSKAGGVSPLTGLLIAALPDRDARVVMDFESEQQAQTNAASRATLATGPAPGKGGDFTDRFAVTSAATDGDQALLDLSGRSGAFVLTDLTTGPVLPATC